MKNISIIILIGAVLILLYHIFYKEKEYPHSENIPVTNELTLTPTKVETLVINNIVKVPVKTTVNTHTVSRDTVYVLTTNYFKTDFDSSDNVMKYKISGYAMSTIDSLKFKYEIKNTFIDSIKSIGYHKGKPTLTKQLLIFTTGLAMGVIWNL